MATQTPTKEQAAPIALEAFSQGRAILLAKVIRTYPDLAWSLEVSHGGLRLPLVIAAVHLDYAAVVGAAIGMFPKDAAADTPAAPDGAAQQLSRLLGVAMNTDKIGIASLLLLAGADPNLRVSSSNGDVDPVPLLSALYRGRSALTRLLLDAGARADVISDDGKDNAVTALISGLRDVRESLYNDPQHPQHLQYREEASEASNVLVNLVNRGADVNFARGSSRFPVKVAIGKKYVKLLGDLIAMGAETSPEALGGELNEVLAKNKLGEHIPHILAISLKRKMKSALNSEASGDVPPAGKIRRTTLV